MLDGQNHVVKSNDNTMGWTLTPKAATILDAGGFRSRQPRLSIINFNDMTGQ
jgi:hypothetical protein